MKKLLVLLVLVSRIGWAESQEVRFVLTNTPNGTFLVDSKTGKMWVMARIEGENGNQFMLSKFWRYDKGRNVCSWSPTSEELFQCVEEKK